MNIAQLKSAIANFPDDAPVLLLASGHMYYTAGIVETEAIRSGRPGNYEYSEYYDDATLEKGDEVKVPALILR